MYKKNKFPRLPMGDTIRIALIERLTERFGLKCWYCGLGLKGKPLHIDHIVPLCLDGNHSIDNMALACVTCNKAKGMMSLKEFFTWIQRIRWLEEFPAKKAFGSVVIDKEDEEIMILEREATVSRYPLDKNVTKRPNLKEI